MIINHSSALKEDLVPAQEKLEWVTPKISLMEAENTDGISKTRTSSEGGVNTIPTGPS
ncbi:hypothetical protein SynSYN20_02552 [Synechococcus sp. SYN20]|nr:hypothetical protein SynSYN20_02552 [Synechococcus sp. SYN20]